MEQLAEFVNERRIEVTLTQEELAMWSGKKSFHEWENTNRHES